MRADTKGLQFSNGGLILAQMLICPCYLSTIRPAQFTVSVTWAMDNITKEGIWHKVHLGGE